MSGLLVPPRWLADRLDEPRVKIVDGSWHMPAQGRDAKAEYLAGHIPGAVFFDIDTVADRASPLPHMLPDATSFAQAAGALGLAETDIIVVYDGVGLYSAPRVWWTLEAFGARDARILDGGLPAWRAAGLPVEAGPVSPARATFAAKLDREKVRDYDAVLGALGDGREIIVDARSAARFEGVAPEPRAGLRSGHMPGARNLPFDRLVEPSGRLASAETIRERFAEAGVDLDRPVVTSCGSGVTAALLAFALASLGKRDAAVYDGSWAEWGARDGAPVVTGPA